MVTSTHSATTPPAIGPLTSYAEMVDYPKLYADLANHGITLSDEDKKKCEAICSDSLHRRDGGSLFGNGFGLIESIPYYMMAFIQNITKLFSGDFKGFSEALSNAGSTISATGEQTKLAQLQKDNVDIYLRLQQASPNLAAAAEYITGVKPSDDNSAPKLLDASILNQVGSHINLPVDTNTSLDDRRNNLSPTSGLPPKPPTQGLTQGR